MPQPSSVKEKQQWKENILKQRESGLSIACWCRKNNIVVHSFCYWRKKLFPKTLLDRSSFTEISDKKKIDISDFKGAGISIEYQGIRVHIDRQFDALTLKRCLEALKDVAC